MERSANTRLRLICFLLIFGWLNCYAHVAQKCSSEFGEKSKQFPMKKLHRNAIFISKHDHSRFNRKPTSLSLVEAVIARDPKTLEEIITNGGRSSPNNLLSSAACFGRPLRVAALLRHLQNKTSITPRPSDLLCSIKRKNAATTLALLTFGNISKSFFTARDPVTGVNALTLLFESPVYFFRVIDRIFQLKLVDANSILDNTDPLIVSAVRNKASKLAIDLLLRNGANVNKANAKGETALHLACQNSMVEVVIQLLSNNAYVMAVTDNKNSPLHYAALYNASPVIVRELIRNGAYIEARNAAQQNPLILATISNGSLENVRLLIDSGGDVDVGDTYRRTPLMHACSTKRIDVVKFLIDHGANVNFRESGGESVLIFSIRQHTSLEIVKLLIDLKADLNVMTGSLQTALVFAIGFDQLETAGVLLDAGADPTIPDGLKITALHWATFQNRPVDFISKLLEHGADASALTIYNETPLSQAVQANNLPVVQVLLKYGAKTNVRDTFGTPLLWAAKSPNSQPQMLAQLLQHGAEVNAMDDLGRTALMYAVENNNYGAVKMLLEWGAAPNAKASSYMLPAPKESQNVVEQREVRNCTALMISAIIGNSVDIANLLLHANGTEIEATDSEGSTALIYGSRSSNVPLVRLLLETGAKPNIRNSDGKTALITATENNCDIEIIQLLIRFGGSINVSGNDGLMPLHFASQNNNLRAVKLLLETGIGKQSLTTALFRAILNNASAEIVELLFEKAGKVDVNSEKDSLGATMLIWAIRNNRAELVTKLLENGASINSSDNRNNSPLLVALYSNSSFEIVNLLLSKGAAVNITNQEGFSPIMLALKYNHTRIVSLLTSYGAVMNTVKRDDSSVESVIVKGSPTSSVKSTVTDKYPFKVLSSQVNAGTKRYKLAVFALLNGYYRPSETLKSPVESGKPPTEIRSNVYDSSSRSCLREALNFLLDVTNSKSQIVNEKDYVLQDYSVEIHYLDDDVPQIFLPQVQELFFASQYLMKENTFISPVVLGPYVVLEGCNFYDSVNAALRQQWKSAGLSKVGYEECPGMVRRSFTPSLATNETDTSLVAIFALINFVKSQNFGFSWQRVALLGDTRYPESVSLLPIYQRWLLSNNITVAAIEIDNNYDDIFERIKAKHTRILFFSSRIAHCSVCQEIWCSSYKAAIRPDKYVFLLVEDVCLKCSPLGANCSVSTVQAQMAMAFFGMKRSDAITQEYAAQSGVAAQLFSSIMNPWYVQNLPLPSAHCSRGNWNTVVLDWLYTMFLIHYGNVTLTERFKTNLHEAVAEGMKNRSKTEIVQQIISEMAAKGGFMGSTGSVAYRNSRIGAVVQANFNVKKFDKIIKYDGYQTWNGLRFEHRVSAFVSSLFTDGNAYNTNFSAHNLTPVSSILWATPDQKPPKDLANVLIVVASYHETAFSVVLASTGFVFLLQTVLAISTAKSHFSEQTITEKKSVSYSDNVHILSSLAGCFLLDVSTVLMLTGTEFFPEPVCWFRPLFCILGLTAINGSLFAKMVTMPAFLHENRYISQKRRQPNLFNLDFHEQQRENNIIAIERKTFKISLSVVASSLILSFLWLAPDPMVLKTALANEIPLYDPDLDSFFNYRIDWCESQSQTYWIAIFAVLEAALLGVGAIIGTVLKHKRRFVRRRWKFETVRIRIAINNAATITVFVALLMVVLPSRPASLWYLKVLCFSIGQLLYSASTSAILCYSTWSPFVNTFKDIFVSLKSSLTEKEK